jgi:NitT/TauT family transport system substrate-binding protein
VQNLARLFGLLLLLVVPACGHEDKEPLRVGTFLWPGSEPLFLARDLGVLDEDSVRLVEYSSLSEVNRAFRNGMLDAVDVTLDMALLFQQAGFESRVVLVLDSSQGADAIIARPEVRRLEDLRGQRVAVEDLAVSTYILSRALEQAGLEPSEVRIVRIPVDEHVRAFTSGEVEAVVTFEPSVSKLLAEDGAHRLFDSTQLPGEILNVLLVREEVLQERPEQVKHLVQGWFRALRYLEEHPDEAVARMSPRLETSPAQLASALKTVRQPSLEENLSLLGPSATALQVAHRLQRFMLSEGLLREPVRPEELMDDRILQEVQEDRR